MNKIILILLLIVLLLFFIPLRENMDNLTQDKLDKIVNSLKNLIEKNNSDFDKDKVNSIFNSFKKSQDSSIELGKRLTVFKENISSNAEISEEELKLYEKLYFSLRMSFKDNELPIIIKNFFILFELNKNKKIAGLPLDDDNTKIVVNLLVNNASLQAKDDYNKDKPFDLTLEDF